MSRVNSTRQYSGSTMHALATSLANTTLNHKCKGASAYHFFPLGITNEEQLLILSGTSDYKLSADKEKTISTVQPAKYVSYDNVGGVKNSMHDHLDMLQDTELAGLMEKRMNISDADGMKEPHTRCRDLLPDYAPVSLPPAYTGPTPFYPTGSLSELKDQYDSALGGIVNRHDFVHAPLPADLTELEALSVYMAGKVNERVRFGKEVVFTPRA